MVSPHESAGDSGPRKIRVALLISVRAFAAKAGFNPLKSLHDLMERLALPTMQRTLSIAEMRLLEKKNGLQVEIED